MSEEKPLSCILLETELELCEYALRKFIEDYPHCLNEFQQLQRKLEKHGYRVFNNEN